MFGKPPLPAGPPPSVDINPAATKSLEEGEDEDGEVHEEGPPQATIAPPTKNVFGLPNNTTFSGSSSVFGKGFLNPAAPLFTPKFGLVGSNPFAAAKSLLLGSSVPTAPGGSAEPTGAKTATSDQSNTDDEPQISNTTPAEEAIPSIINTQEVGEKPELSEIDASVEKLAPVSDAVPVAKSDEPVKAGETKSTENVPTDEEKASHGITGVTEVPLSTVSTSNTSTITPGKTVVIKSTAPSTGKQGSKVSSIYSQG